MNNKNQVLLEVNHLKTHFPIKKGLMGKIVGYVKAVDGVNFVLRKKETLGVVGESGCGKSTLANSIIRAVNPTAGETLFHIEGERVVDIAQLKESQLKEVRKHIQMIFQDPYSSLNPRMTVRDIIGDPLIVHKIARGSELNERVIKLMGDVGLEADYLKRYPHAFSGGQRQRIGVARALALNPQLILADEPTSALDVSVQAQILNLLNDLQEEHDLSYIFISHDLSVVKHISDRVAIMYVGSMVEISPTQELFAQPSHPYSEALLSAVPQPNPHYQKKRILLRGDVADPANLPEGCPFHPRCDYADEICKEEKPPLKLLKERSDHWVACHFAEDLELRGVVIS